MAEMSLFSSRNLQGRTIRLLIRNKKIKRRGVMDVLVKKYNVYFLATWKKIQIYINL